MEDYQEKIYSGVILVYNCYSEQPICNLTKKDFATGIFWRNVRKLMAVDSYFGTVQVEDFQTSILGGVILVHNRYSEPPVFPREIFKNG